MKAAPGAAEYARRGALLETGPSNPPATFVSLDSTERFKAGRNPLPSHCSHENAFALRRVKLPSSVRTFVDI